MFTDGVVNLYTADLGAGLAFYRDLLGFAETFRYPADGVPQHVELRVGGFTIALSDRAALEAYGLPPAVTPGAAFEVAVRATDVDRATAGLRAAGVPVLREPFDAPNGQRVAYLLDPDGNRLHLYGDLAAT